MAKWIVSVTYFSIFGIPLISALGDISEDFGGLPRAVKEPKTMRKKRILWGEPLMEPKSYAVMQFVVYITNGRCRHMYELDVHTPHAAPSLLPISCIGIDESTYMCGGALIAETIVQTACHCITHIRADNITHSTVVPDSVWENAYGLYMGEYDVRRMTYSALPRRYIHHKKCAKWGEQQISYDFGLILTNAELIHSPHSRRAPYYAMKELTRMYNRIQDEQHVCLLLGWGEHRLVCERCKGVPSRYLQHTWSRVMSYRECYNSHPPLKTFLLYFGRELNLTYMKLNTWFCARRFGKFNGLIGGGDSGSPVTCNNIYTGLVSSASAVHYSIKKKSYIGFKSTLSSISFTEEENSAECRVSFIRKNMDALIYGLREYEYFKNRPDLKKLGRAFNGASHYHEPGPAALFFMIVITFIHFSSHC